MIDGALWAVIALAVAVVVYVELRIRAVKKATGTAPGFMDEVRKLIGGLRSQVNDVHYSVQGVQITTDATHAAVTAPTVQPAGFVLSEGASTGGVSTKGFVLSEGATLGGSDAAQRARQTALDRAALNAMREDGVNPKGFVLSEDAPKVPRIEDLEGPKIADWVSVNAPGMMPKISRIIHWWAMHPRDDAVPGTGYPQSLEAIKNDDDLRYADQINAQGQRIRDEQANVSGVDFRGPYGVGTLGLQDGLYLAVKAGEYANITGRAIWELLYGTANECNAFINDVCSTHAGEIATFDAGSYDGPLKAGVEMRMRGI